MDFSMSCLQNSYRRFAVCHFTGRLLFAVVLVQNVVIFALLRNSVRFDFEKRKYEKSVDIHDIMNDEEEGLLLRSNVTSVEGHLQDISVYVPRHPLFIFFNRVPKCGSSTIIDVISDLYDVNKFSFVRSGEFMAFHAEARQLIEFTRSIKKLSTPLLYERHMHYINADAFSPVRPLYINIVREPLDRLSSWYYFRRYQIGHIRPMTIEERMRTYDACVLGNYSECTSPGGSSSEEGYFKLIPFFCGQDAHCREPTQQAYNQAMYNLQEHYLTVGTLSQLAEFIEVLEFLLPDFFKGAMDAYNQKAAKLAQKHRTTYKLPVSPEAARVMRPRIELEMKFYYFIRRRFERQLELVREAKTRILETSGTNAR